MLVDLAGRSEVGLSANRLARDIGFGAGTILVGAMSSAFGVIGGLTTGAVFFVIVAAGTWVVGETRRGVNRPAPTSTLRCAP